MVSSSNDSQSSERFDQEGFSRSLLNWYERHARRLPWRDQPTPYRVWISEIMLQQTRVETVLPYFARWIERFPDVATLASATEQDVLQAWEGLGYYSRARNLFRAAQELMRSHGGQIPARREDLERLPGIGRYTAGAIASIAFGADEPALDANIRRVLARVFNVELPARSPEGERLLWKLAEMVLPAGRAGDFNQALMDLGSSICTPRQPACLICPVANFCAARAFGVQEARPVLDPKQGVPHYTVTAAVIRRGDRYLIAQRPPDGLLGGMWEFPGGKVEPGETLPECLRREISEEMGALVRVGDEFGSYQHGYTHFKVTLHAFCCTIEEGEPLAIHASDIRWATAAELTTYPMGKIDRQIARRIQKDPESCGRKGIEEHERERPLF